MDRALCNLYTVRKSVDEVARHFGVMPPTGLNTPAEVYPGAPGLVIREQDGQRVLQSMGWGFPMRFNQAAQSAVREGGIARRFGKRAMRWR